MKPNFICVLTSLIFSGLLVMSSMSLAAEDTWTKKADMPTARVGPSTCVVDGRIYAIGGVVCSLDGSCEHPIGAPAVSTVEEYDPASDTWTKKADMPTARKAPGTSVVDGKIYAIGGATGAEAPPVDPMGFILSTVEVYDPATDTWTMKADMPTARTFLSTSVVNGKIYAIGGDVALWPWSPIPTVEEYDTGFVPPKPTGVEAKGKLTTTWGEIKSSR